MLSMIRSDEHNSSSTADRVDLFERLVLTNRDAFNLLRFNTAYHALAAAMHEAKQEKDTARLAQVARTADEQLVWINCHAAGYEHSTASCNARRTTSIYTLLGRQARTNERMILQVRA